MTKARDLASASIVPAAVSVTELGYIDGVTSAIQTQMNTKAATAATINPTIVDAKGDLIAATAADAVSRLAVGANGTTLTADSTAATGMKWAAAAAGGMTLITSGTLSGSSITLSSIPQTYKNLQLVLRACRPTNMNQGPLMRFNGDTATSYYRTTAGAINLVTWNETALRLGSTQDNTTSQSFSVTDLYDYTNTTTWKTCTILTIQNRATSPTNFDINNGQASFWYANNGASAITSIELFTDTYLGFASGTYLLYGVS